MAKGLEIRRRIKSIKNISSITKAMGMVASSKMKKAQEKALKTRDYAIKALEILEYCSNKIKHYHHYLLDTINSKDVLVFVVSSNKGLCGSFNANIIRKVYDFIKKHEQDKIFHFVTCGKKARDTLLKTQMNIIADFSDIKESYSFLDYSQISTFLLQEYKSKKYSGIYVIYSHFASIIKQNAVIRRIVPLGKGMIESFMETKPTNNNIEEEYHEYLFEPDASKVLEELLLKFVEMQIFQAILENHASEQAARMIAMKNASDAAIDLISDLTLSYNKSRQSSITQEISEIIGGVEALKT